MWPILRRIVATPHVGIRSRTPGFLRLLCSTPIGITDELTLAWDNGIVPVQRCSTPIGITDELTSRSCGSTVSALIGCSTPIGITDELTLFTTVITDAFRMCSTPIGITDELTSSSN
jgi:hypothetical protein